jgi:hypothetical protein
MYYDLKNENLASPSANLVQQQQLIAWFIQDFYPPMNPGLRTCERIHHYWVQCLPAIHGRGGLLNTAIMALCASFLGRIQNDKRLQQRAMVM